MWKAKIKLVCPNCGKIFFLTQRCDSFSEKRKWKEWASAIYRDKLCRSCEEKEETERSVRQNQQEQMVELVGEKKNIEPAERNRARFFSSVKFELERVSATEEQTDKILKALRQMQSAEWWLSVRHTNARAWTRQTLKILG